MTSPKVSIIIDSYNHERFVTSTVESALAQTYPNCEVIVVDDGSPDGTRQVLEPYADRVSIFLKENGGQASSFNLGFEKSTGDLIIFLDSDDLLDPDAVATAVSHWQDHYTKLQFHLRIIGADSTPTGLRMPSCKLSEGDVRRELITTGHYITAPTSGNMFSRQFLSKLMPMPTRDWMEGNDTYLSIYAGFMGAVGAIQQELGCYRVHESNMTGVTTNNRVNLKQVDKLISHGLRQQTLIQQIAEEMKIVVHPQALELHWFHLKLVIAKQKLGSSASLHGRPLWMNVVRFSKSVWNTRQLTFLGKLKLIAWSLVAALLPSAYATRFVSYAFEKAPKSKFLRLLRGS